MNTLALTKIDTPLNNISVTNNALSDVFELELRAAIPDRNRQIESFYANRTAS